MVKVLDFGLAKTIEPAGASTVTGAALSLSPTIMSPAMTQVGMLLGTAAYMSPEQARGKDVDKRADIWAFGCVVFEMVTGRRAFAGDDVTETITAVMRDQPDLKLAPVQIRRALARCFEKDPRKRLRDIGDVWALIDDDVHARDLPAVTTPAWRRVLPWALVTAATVVAIGMSVSHPTETRVAPRPVRFQLQIPDEAGGSTPAMSPDGTLVAYRAAGQIWVRDLNSLESRPVASTDRPVGRMFWSADSRSVMYGAAGKLMRIAAAGGSPEVLRDISQVVAGGFGLPDGGMVVSGVTGRRGGDGDTVRIDSSGEHPLSGIQGQAWLEGGVSLLPDGKRIVYSLSEPEASRGVYVASIDGATAPVRLLPEASDAAYVPSVTRSWRGVSPVAAPGHVSSRCPLTPHSYVRVANRSCWPRASGGLRRRQATRSSTVATPDGDSRGTTGRDRRRGRRGRWRPTWRSPFRPTPVASSLSRADGPTTWVHEFSSESRVKAAPALGVVIKPLWAPKDNRLTLLHANRTTGTADIVTIAAGGSGGEELVLRAPGIVYPTSWSRDGQWLLYTNVDPRTKEDLWVVPMTTSGAGTPQPSS